MFVAEQLTGGCSSWREDGLETWRAWRSTRGSTVRAAVLSRFSRSLLLFQMGEGTRPGGPGVRLMVCPAALPQMTLSLGLKRGIGNSCQIKTHLGLLAEGSEQCSCF